MALRYACAAGREVVVRRPDAEVGLHALVSGLYVAEYALALTLKGGPELAKAGGQSRGLV
jgi:hypothetical protein